MLKVDGTVQLTRNGVLGNQSSVGHLHLNTNGGAKSHVVVADADSCGSVLWPFMSSHGGNGLILFVEQLCVPIIMTPSGMTVSRRDIVTQPFRQNQSDESMCSIDYQIARLMPGRNASDVSGPRRLMSMTS